MKILLSAYACRPHMGSEPAVGWTWVVELSKYHDLWVLTNFTNREKIEEYRQNNPNCLSNVQFIYIRPNKKITVFYKEWERLERFYYVLWQKSAYIKARELNQTIHFDYIQHITYVTCILPTYMHKLGIPFIYGPVSGGESIPKVINYPMSTKNALIEFIRSATQLIPMLSLNTRLAFKKAVKIIAVTEETKALIPKKYQDKVALEQAIGINSDYFEPAPLYDSNDLCRVLMVGRMIYWKGFEAGIHAVIKALEQGSNIELTVLGSGNKKHTAKLKKLAAYYLDTKIKFVDSIHYEKMKSFYERFDVLLNCSLRDSGCLVVMEAMSRGLPVICIDTGGPKMNTSSECALKIAPVCFDKLIDELSGALIMCAKDPEYRTDLGRAAYRYAKNNFNVEVKIKNFFEKNYA